MRISHVAIWTNDIDSIKRFYRTYFDAIPGPRYINPAKGFESCFLLFGDGARLEIMKTTSLPLSARTPGTQSFGLTHLAIEVGADHRVDELARRLADDGVAVLEGPRRTSDGYYEAVTLDPDGNRVEICAERADTQRALERTRHE